MFFEQTELNLPEETKHNISDWMKNGSDYLKMKLRSQNAILKATRFHKYSGSYNGVCVCIFECRHVAKSQNLAMLPVVSTPVHVADSPSLKYRMSHDRRCQIVMESSCSCLWLPFLEHLSAVSIHLFK